MSFASRQTRSPRPYDPDRGADVAALLPDLTGGLADLIAGTAGCSPYLAGLIVREKDWLVPALDDPEAALAAVLSALPDTPPDQIAPMLRRAKRRVAVLAALADLAGVWPLETVTQGLTDLADAATATALTSLFAAELSRGKLPMFTEDDLATTGGITVLAMGKMGAGELNYSSDIDLICLMDEGRVSRDDYPEVRQTYVRIIRRLTAVLSDQTDGYVFRTDLRLRPDASVTPVILTMDAAERYYESVGRTWERAAYIKARPCAGDMAAGDRFLRTLTPFVWRKHLDFAAIQDAHDMRLRIRDHKRLHGLALPGHNMKLGQGGIREIEFFTQTRQLIAGGRDPALRVRGTCDGLARLAGAGWVPPHDAATLTDHYRAHRLVEHRLQMLNDAQTHDLPTAPEGFDRLAAFMDTTTRDLTDDLIHRLDAVHTLTEGFFAPGQTGHQTVHALPGAVPDAPAAPVGDDFGADIVARWRSYPALRSERAVALFKRLRPEIMAHLQDAARPDEALLQFDGFLAGLPAGVQLFSLFDANPQLTRLIVDICATAPALASYLSRNSGVFDAVIGGSFFADWPGATGLDAALSRALKEAGDYEAGLTSTRRWAKEWHFRIGVHHLRGLIDAETAGSQYAQLADAVLRGIWPLVLADFTRKHGGPPGRGAALLGMGSLGAGRLNALSDLDLVLIYDDDGVEASEGPRPLATRPYYARLTQALVTALTAPMADGKLYEVDMRLRPSGRQGPVATSLTAFQDYQRSEAWTWEHLALTRARPVAGGADLMTEVETFRHTLLTEKSSAPTILPDVAEMRARIAAAKPPQGDWDAKIGPGRLQDVELMAQTLALRTGSPARDTARQIGAGVAGGMLSAADAGALTRAAGLFWNLQASARLLTGGVTTPDDLGEGGRRLILRETGASTILDLETMLKSTSDAAAAVIDTLLTGPTP